MFVAATDEGVYGRLAAPFEVTFTDLRGGVELTYVTGEQVASRLNEVLGVSGWSFRVLRHDINPEADEVWALGELVAEVDGKTVVRQQFGSQKLKRSRSTGSPLDIGFDLKGAATDAMKKCASLLGVGLYLSRKEVPKSKAPVCEQCGEVLGETRFKDGQLWDAPLLAAYGRRKHGRVLCFEHYRAANAVLRNAALQEVPASA